MREFQERKKIKQRMYSVWSLLVLLVVIGLFTKAVVNVYEKAKITRLDLQRLEVQKSDIESRYNTITKESDSLKTNDGMETVIRQKFDVAKKGEGVIVIVDKTVEQPIPEKGFAEKVWDSVVGVFH